MHLCQPTGSASLCANDAIEVRLLNAVQVSDLQSVRDLHVVDLELVELLWHKLLMTKAMRMMLLTLRGIHLMAVVQPQRGIHLLAVQQQQHGVHLLALLLHSANPRVELLPCPVELCLSVTVKPNLTAMVPPHLEP